MSDPAAPPPPVPVPTTAPTGVSAPAVPGESRETSGPLDRATLERVLARAAELQLAAGDDAETDGLTYQQLLEVGREVGLPVMYLRQALAEERTRVVVPVERGLVAQMAGAGWASAHRVIAGTAASVTADLNQTMLRDESLAVKRRFADRITWEPRRDFWAAFRRVATAGGRSFDLLRAQEVGGTIVPIDESHTLVRLDADVSHTRSQRLQGGAAIMAGGAVSSGLLVGAALMIHALLLPVLVVAAVPVAVGGAVGMAVARTHRQTVQRAQLALEQVLDRLEHGEARRPPTFVDVLTR